MYKEEIEKIIIPVINRNNCFLWGTEILRGKKITGPKMKIDGLPIFSLKILYGLR